MLKFAAKRGIEFPAGRPGTPAACALCMRSRSGSKARTSAVANRKTSFPMDANDSFHIAVIAGDGIGIEVMAPALELLRKLERSHAGLKFRFTEAPAGANHYRETGTALPEATVKLCAEADAILLGACGLPDVRYPDGTEIAPQVELRTILDLYAGIRPCRGLPGVPPTLARCPPEAIDLVVVRESTEGLFASRSTGIVLGDAVATDTQIITRAGTERVVRAAFDWCRDRPRAPDRPRRVTCVDKAN